LGAYKPKHKKARELEHSGLRSLKRPDEFTQDGGGRKGPEQDLQYWKMGFKKKKKTQLRGIGRVHSSKILEMWVARSRGGNCAGGRREKRNSPHG